MKKIKNTTVIALALLLTNNTFAIDLSEDLESEFLTRTQNFIMKLAALGALLRLFLTTRPT